MEDMITEPLIELGRYFNFQNVNTQPGYFTFFFDRREQSIACTQARTLPVLWAKYCLVEQITGPGLVSNDQDDR